MNRRLLTFFRASKMALSYKGQGASLVNDIFGFTFHHKSLLQAKKQQRNSQIPKIHLRNPSESQTLGCRPQKE
jgi:hypothetical protein